MMGPKINIVYSTSHWVVPKIIIGVLLFFGALIVVTEGVQRQKVGEPFFKVPEGFFLPDYDKLKFWGTIVLFALYIFALDLIGFVPASIIFLFLFNCLFTGKYKGKALVTSIVISVVAPLIIWYIFGVVFNITLPIAQLF